MKLTQQDLDVAYKYGLQEAVLCFWPDVPDVGPFSNEPEDVIQAAGERLLGAGPNQARRTRRNGCKKRLDFCAYHGIE